MARTNSNGLDAANIQPAKTHTKTDTEKFTSKSTSTEAQRHRIIAALRRGPKTSYDLRCLGCYQAPARVKELRDRFGFNISTERVTLCDHDGYTHPRAALYTLISEPG
jgi:hypothetical protein